MKWKYRTYYADADESFDDEERAMNSLGAEGWELVSVVRLSDGAMVMYFKKCLGLLREDGVNRCPDLRDLRALFAAMTEAFGEL